MRFFSHRLALPALLLGLGLIMVAASAWLTLMPRDVPPPPSAIGGNFQLIDQDGRTFTQDNLQGQISLIFFGYTHCPDVCPTTLFETSEILRQLGPSAKIGVYFITVDPERDTPAVLRDYLSSFDNRIRGLTGDRAAVDGAVKAYRAYARKVPSSKDDAKGEYSMDHSAIIYLIDKKGRFINPFNLDQAQETAVAELRKRL